MRVEPRRVYWHYSSLIALADNPCLKQWDVGRQPGWQLTGLRFPMMVAEGGWFHGYVPDETSLVAFSELIFSLRWSDETIVLCLWDSSRSRTAHHARYVPVQDIGELAGRLRPLQASGKYALIFLKTSRMSEAHAEHGVDLSDVGLAVQESDGETVQLLIPDGDRVDEVDAILRGVAQPVTELEGL